MERWSDAGAIAVKLHKTPVETSHSYNGIVDALKEGTTP
jgi:hypothetical protein